MTAGSNSTLLALAKSAPPSQDPTVGLYLGSYVGPRWGGAFLMSEVPLYEGFVDPSFSLVHRFLTTHVKRVRGGLVFKAHSLLYHLTLGVRVIKTKRRLSRTIPAAVCGWLLLRGVVACRRGYTRSMLNRY